MAITKFTSLQPFFLTHMDSALFSFSQAVERVELEKPHKWCAHAPYGLISLSSFEGDLSSSQVDESTL